VYIFPYILYILYFFKYIKIFYIYIFLNIFIFYILLNKITKYEIKFFVFFKSDAENILWNNQFIHEYRIKSDVG